jgi:RHS repeat-associated protein
VKNLAILAQIDTQKLELSDTLRIFEEFVGVKNYELSNHLGNVLATISDKTIFNTDHYNGIVYSAQLYYPFGWEIPTLSYTAKKYRFGFNGKEDDREWHAQDYGFRLYTPREARFISVDPITAEYPELTPYQFASNTPIQAVDLDGLESYPVNEGSSFMSAGSAFWGKAPQVSTHTHIAPHSTTGALTTNIAQHMYSGDKPLATLSEDDKKNIFYGDKNVSNTTAILLHEFATGTGPKTRHFDQSTTISDAIRNSTAYHEANVAFHMALYYHKQSELGFEGKLLDKEGDNLIYAYGYGFSPDHISIPESMNKHAVSLIYPSEKILFHRGGMSFKFSYNMNDNSLSVKATDKYRYSSIAYRLGADIDDHTQPYGSKTHEFSFPREYVNEGTLPGRIRKFSNDYPEHSNRLKNRILKK